jgi:hypothetical protein
MDYAQELEEGFNGRESNVEKETPGGCSADGRKAAPVRSCAAAGSGRGVGSVRERATAPAHPVSPACLLAVLHACPVLLGEARVFWSLGRGQRLQWESCRRPAVAHRIYLSELYLIFLSDMPFPS